MIQDVDDSVDVIMPTYRPTLTLLKRAIQSVIEQTHRKWQLILVQDGHDCELECMIRGIDDTRINYFEMSHKGKSAALNFALAKGNSRYTAYLDDDDIWYPNHLETAIGYMRKNDVRFVHTDAYQIAISIEDSKLVEGPKNRLNKGVLTDKTLWNISHTNVIHERSLLALSGNYDESLNVFIDWDMLQRLSMHAKPHHLDIYTCEHYVYRNKQPANISSFHQDYPDLSRARHREMFSRAFELLAAEDFVEIVEEHQALIRKVEELEKNVKLPEGASYNFFGCMMRGLKALVGIVSNEAHSTPTKKREAGEPRLFS